MFDNASEVEKVMSDAMREAHKVAGVLLGRGDWEGLRQVASEVNHLQRATLAMHRLQRTVRNRIHGDDY